MSVPTSSTPVDTLRRRLKAGRKALSGQARQRAVQAIVSRLEQDSRFRRARRIAAYVSHGGEVDTSLLLALVTTHGKACYLPVLHPTRKGRLWFVRWFAGDPLRRNRWGIPEPLPGPGKRVHPRWLDVIVVPLLGFDERGHRLGMGGGFYDRSLAFVNRTGLQRRPRLIGIAFESQRVTALQPRPWDVQLDSVITEQAQYPLD